MGFHARASSCEGPCLWDHRMGAIVGFTATPFEDRP